jgi:hypothetical protein
MEAADILSSLVTDKNKLFSTPRNISAHTLISEIIATQKIQLSRLQAMTFKQIDPAIAEVYVSQMAKAVRDNESEFLKYQTEVPLETISVQELASAQSQTELSVVRDHVSSFAIATNSILAELLTAIHYRNVLLTEETMPVMFGEYWNQAHRDLQRRTEPAMENYFETKRMDLKVKHYGAIHFLEVKYLGTRQEYTKASGSHVLQKLENVKYAADQLPFATKVVLVLVGRGRLSSHAKESYAQLGIEVLHLTPDWQ